MQIVSVEPFILHVPVTGQEIADSMHRLTHWGVPGVILHTDSGLSGCGYSGTHAHLPTDRLIAGFIAQTAAPLLLGEDPARIEHLWKKIYHFPPAQWVGRAGITHLGLGAIDVALWDLRAKAAGKPLWQLMSAQAEAPKLEAYNTDGGWLNLARETVVANAKRFTQEEGFRGVKLKIGKPDPAEDLARVAAVRKAIGPGVKLMVDANGKWPLQTALEWCPRLRELDVYWIEEPLWYDDIPAHAELAARSEIPVALGEQLYSFHDFRNFIRAGAVRFVQPDVTRLAGVTEWKQVADLAAEHDLPVAAHVGDMMQVHLHTSLAHPACAILEYIPWIRRCFTEPATVQDGDFVPPQEPGAGTTLTAEAIEKFAQPLQ
ncbi:MAG: mandelate racemase/muconate lactonizing enzyme family protein [Planctomycetota bacterium]|nr:mandelate racemase/muconate lactonizing enzyme family protein [Planctomycetota bacterium]